MTELTKLEAEISSLGLAAETVRAKMHSLALKDPSLHPIAGRLHKAEIYACLALALLRQHLGSTDDISWTEDYLND